MSLIHLEKILKTEELVVEIDARFAAGATVVNLAKGERIVGTILSPEVAQSALASRLAEQWSTHPDLLAELSESVTEEPEDWN